MGAAASALLGYIAYNAPTTTLRNFYIAAAVTPSLVGPFTILVLNPTNQKLLAKAEAFDKKETATTGDGTTVPSLLATWRDLNYVRTLFPAIAMGMAIYGVLM